MRKIIVIFVFVLFNCNVINALDFTKGPAIIYEKPNGVGLLRVNDNTFINKQKKVDCFYNMTLIFKVKKESITNNTIPVETDIYDIQLNIIGKFISDLHFNIEDNEDSNLISFGGFNKDGFGELILKGYISDTNIKPITIEDALATKRYISTDSCEARFVVLPSLGTTLYLTNDVTYEYDRIFYDNKRAEDYIIKKSTLTKLFIARDFGDRFIERNIKYTYYPNFSVKDTFSVSKDANDFFLNVDDDFPYGTKGYDGHSLYYYYSSKYGKSKYGTPQYYGNADTKELSTFPDNKVFLKFSEKYYHIVIPNTENHVYFGLFNSYATNSWSPNGSDSIDNDYYKVGEIYYSINCKQNGKIILRAKNIFRGDFCFDSISFVKKAKSDRVTINELYNTLVVNSLNNMNNLSKFNDVGIKVYISRSKKQKVYKILIQNGEIKEKYIDVEF